MHVTVGIRETKAWLVRMDLLGHRRGSIEGCREGVLWLWGKGRGTERGTRQWECGYGALEGGYR